MLVAGVRLSRVVKKEGLPVASHILQPVHVWVTVVVQIPFERYVITGL